MAKILIAWELGAGLGHLTPLVPIVEQLDRRGHELFAAVRDLSKVEALFSGLGVTFLQAPIKTSSHPSEVKEPRSFAHILYNNGFGDRVELRGMASAWDTLFGLVQPDLILCDHAPIALLASRASRARRAIIGTGFCCPPDVCPIPDLRPWLGNASEELRQAEDLVLGNANAVLAAWRLPNLERLSQMYREVDRTFLTTLAEFDHYPSRGHADYIGTWCTPGGKPPQWPEAPGKKIFAYLKAFKTLPELLEVIKQAGCPTLVYIDGLNPAIRDRFETPALRFVTERLDLAAVGATCDLAILNGGHNVTCLMLLCGKPVLTVPLNLEQAYNGSAVARVDAGFGALPENPESFASTLADVLASEKYCSGARRFAAKYEHLIPDQQIHYIIDQLDQIARGS